MRRLPPLTAVEAFVQVARLGSVKAAADELALSSPALSRRVQALERFVGRPLFARRHQAMMLNPDGERLLAGIAPALDALSEAIDGVSGEAEGMRLRLGVMPLYASRQLIPRLPSLRARYPQLQVELDTVGNSVARLGEGLDAVITLMHDVEPPLYGRKLSSNMIAIFTGGALAEGPDAIRTPQDLARATVMVHRDMADNFDVWCAGMGIEGLKPAALVQYDSGPVILESAAQGLGVGFMLDVNFESAADPRLVGLFGDRPIESTFSYWFICRRAALERRPVRLFHDWLVDGRG